MPSRLIINADDFGLTTGINRSILELHRAGVLTSATLMASGSAFEDAVAIAKANPTLGVGCHLVFTDGTPVSAPERIPTLIGADRKTFRPKLVDFIRALLLGQIREEDIVHEAYAQINRLVFAGLRPTHVDTHKHTHLFPRMASLLLKVAKGSSIPAIRNPFEPAFTRNLAHAGFKRRMQVRILNSLESRFQRLPEIRDHDVATSDGTVGVSATGNLNTETLSQILATLPSEGTFELVCHPGYNDRDLDRVTTRLRQHREIEMQALLSAIPVALTQPNGPQLIHFGSLAPTHA